MGASSFFVNLVKNFSPQSVYNYHKRCIDNFGFPFMALMTSTYFITNGMLESMIGAGETSFYIESDYLDTTQIQVNSTITSIPSSLKGLFGVISDNFPLFGYHKASYMAITSIFSTIALILVSTIPLDILFSFPQFPALLFFLVIMQGQFHDLMMQGKFVEMMINKPESKGDLVTYSWFYQTIGKFIPTLFVGSYADSDLEMQTFFIFAIPLAIQPFAFLAVGCMVNDKVPSGQANKLKTAKLMKHWKITLMAVAIGVCAIVNVLLTFFNNNTLNFVYAICAAIFLGALSFYTLPLTIAKAVLYIFLCDMVYLNMYGPFNYWFLADEDCVPGGPHFSYTYFQTFVGIADALCSCLGIIIFQVYVCNWKLRHIYWVTTVIRVLASCTDIIIVQRWNIAIGISDEVFYMLGNTIIYRTLYMVDFMPSNLLIAKLCPKTVEATVFAIIAGFANYGVAIGSFIGVFIQDLLGVVGSATYCNYDNFVWLIVICNMAGPLLNLVNTFWMIPNIKITEDFVKKFYDETKFIDDNTPIPQYVLDAQKAQETY